MSPVEYVFIGLIILWIAVIIWIEVGARKRMNAIKQEIKESMPADVSHEAPAEKPLKSEAEKESISPAEELPDILCQFVFNAKGEQIGETIAFDGDLVIIKQKEKYLAVPAKHIETKDGKLVVAGVTDWTIAEKLAEKWKENSTKFK